MTYERLTMSVFFLFCCSFYPLEHASVLGKIIDYLISVCRAAPGALEKNWGCGNPVDIF